VAFKEALSDDFKVYQKQVVANAKAMAEEFLKRGYGLVTGGTDNHLMLIDLRSKDITGKEASDVLDEAGITVNKNLIPYDPLPATKTSGIRIGTPAMTTRGMKEAEMVRIVEIIDAAVENKGDAAKLVELKKQSLELAHSFPLYSHLSR
jgi:glycine hydroxymethyltransferase